MNKNPNITDLIQSVEEKYLVTLWNNCRAQFENSFIPSHDHYHHYRVWSFLKELLAELSNFKFFSKIQIEQLIIATWFHDTGLSKVLDEKHGLESAKICQEFLAENFDGTKEEKEEILNAIESHDDKNYKTINISELHTDILSVLNVC